MKRLLNPIYDIELLSSITPKILYWDYSLVKGESIYKKVEKYAHIGLTIYPIESYRDEIVWNVKEIEIPEGYYSEIEIVLSFLRNYIKAIKGRSDKSLGIEIFDGSFNLDSNNNSFGFATIRAIVNCFDKSQFNINDVQKELIQNNKDNAINLLKQWAIIFSENEIIESLLNDELTKRISNLLDDNDMQLIKDFFNQKVYCNLEQIQKKFLKDKQYFTDNKVLTKYGDVSRIGYAHFCKISRHKEYFPFLGVFNLEKINHYF